VRTRGFDAIADRAARVLILGTLPSQISLQKSEYYAQPRNGFWKIMGALFGFDALAPYSERTGRLVSAGIGLWDVCHSATRPGSLDISIQDEVANDFGDFLRSHGQLRLICFNGATAAKIYRRRVILPKDVVAIADKVLPSTSPAHAAMSYREKLARWSIVRTECETS
jgi:double-stranded uracil-DNA glycosylase